MAFSACSEEVKLEFPEGLEPLEEISVDLPAGTSAEPYPQELNFASGETDDYAWAHARGYLHQDLLSAWGKMRTPEVYVDMNEVTAFTVDEVSNDQYDYVFVVHNIVDNIITVEFDVEWRHGAASGDVNDPGIVAIRWQKTEGTDHIGLLQGSLQFFPVNDEAGEPIEDILEVQFIYHLKATLDQAENSIRTVSDIYSRWL